MSFSRSLYSPTTLSGASKKFEPSLRFVRRLSLTIIAPQALWHWHRAWHGLPRMRRNPAISSGANLELSSTAAATGLIFRPYTLNCWLLVQSGFHSERQKADRFFPVGLLRGYGCRWCHNALRRNWVTPTEKSRPSCPSTATGWREKVPCVPPVRITAPPPTPSAAAASMPRYVPSRS